MQILKQLKTSRKLKKSHTLLIGSLFIFMGVLSFSWNYLEKVREALFSDMKISMMDAPKSIDYNNDDNINPEVINNINVESNYTIDYSSYLGVLEIPNISLKRGFYGLDSRYNNIKYNVTLVEGSSLPDVYQGNLILMAHSGDSYISFFAYLYKLNIGDDCYVTYNGNGYHYVIVDIYEVEKNGVVSIRRDRSKNTLTLITCTKDNDSSQTVYIAELV